MTCHPTPSNAVILTPCHRRCAQSAQSLFLESSASPPAEAESMTRPMWASIPPPLAQVRHLRGEAAEAAQQLQSLMRENADLENKAHSAACDLGACRQLLEEAEGRAEEALRSCQELQLRAEAAEERERLGAERLAGLTADLGMIRQQQKRMSHGGSTAAAAAAAAGSRFSSSGGGSGGSSGGGGFSSGDQSAELRAVGSALSAVQVSALALAARLASKTPQALSEEIEAQVCYWNVSARSMKF